MSSLVTNLNTSAVQEIVNWVTITTADGCVHTPTRRNSTSLLAKLFRLVKTVANYIAANSVHTADATQLDS